ncbi:MAG: dihydroxyphthalate decarboxylase [Betaproteobacteria bacterium]|nr:dihydroxyphthalate decarboxylase [Betaproteobacteria bacterium]
MSGPAFTVHGGIYEHVVNLAGIENGIELKYQPEPNVNALFAAMIAKRAFEVCEFSLANYLTLRGSGNDWLTAIPIFPNRAFRHATLMVKRESPITRIGQLAGKRIGVEDYSMTAAVWVRGLLQDEYGVDPASITWISGKSQRFAPPAGAKVEASDSDYETLLMEGSVDAIVGLTLRDAKLPPRARTLRSILSDPEAAELAYYERTGIYPINHCVCIRNDALKQCPELPEAIARAYLRSKDLAYQQRLGSTLIPWGKSYWSRMFEVFDGDPLPNGLTPGNRHVVKTLGRYLCEQGFIEQEPDIDSIFLVPQCLAGA